MPRKRWVGQIDDVYSELETSEGSKKIYKIAKTRDKATSHPLNKWRMRTKKCWRMRARLKKDRKKISYWKTRGWLMEIEYQIKKWHRKSAKKKSTKHWKRWKTIKRQDQITWRLRRANVREKKVWICFVIFFRKVCGEKKFQKNRGIVP